MWAFCLLVAFVVAVGGAGPSWAQRKPRPTVWDLRSGLHKHRDADHPGRVVNFYNRRVETSLCGSRGAVYNRNPLQYPAGAPDHCFPGGDVLLVVKSGHKTGTEFGIDLVDSIHEYCSAAAEEAGAPVPLHPKGAFHNRHCEEYIDREVHNPTNSSLLLFCPEHALWFNCVDVERIGSRLRRGRRLRGENHTPAKTVKLLHLVRDPVEMVMSGYNYHKSGPSMESWLWKEWPMEQRPPAYRTGHYRNMTYLETLQELPLHKGLALEADKMQMDTRHGGAVRQMASICCMNTGNPDYQLIRFKSFYGKKAVESSCRLARFLGLPLHHANRFAAIMRRRAHQFNTVQENNSEHVTKGTYDKEEQLAILEQYRHYHRLLAVRSALQTGQCNREECELCFHPAVDEDGNACTT